VIRNPSFRFDCLPLPAAGKIIAEECDKSGISDTSVHGAEQVSLFASALPYAALRHLLFVHGSVRPFMPLFLYPAQRINSVQTNRPTKMAIQLSPEGNLEEFEIANSQHIHTTF